MLFEITWVWALLTFELLAKDIRPSYLSFLAQRPSRVFAIDCHRATISHTLDQQCSQDSHEVYWRSSNHQALAETVRCALAQLRSSNYGMTRNCSWMSLARRSHSLAISQGKYKGSVLNCVWPLTWTQTVYFWIAEDVPMRKLWSYCADW